MSEYINALERVNLLHKIIEVDVKRMGYVSNEDRKQLHDKIMNASVHEIVGIHDEFEKTKDFSLREIEEYRKSDDHETKQFISLSERKNSIMDFNLDANSLAILNGIKKPISIDDQEKKVKKFNPYDPSSK